MIRWNRTRCKYILCCSVLILFLISGKPKSIFRTNFHIPWLTDVQHVIPLTCIPDRNQSTWPRVVSNVNSNEENRLTIVIVTARPEFKRLPLTLAALACHLDSRRVFEVIFLIPPQDVDILRPFLSNEFWPWPLSIRSDDSLLKHIHTDSYRLQMMFKLIVAQMIQTEFYLVLDSDCVAIWPIHVEQLLYQTNRSQQMQALYQIEERNEREKWWIESEQILQIEPNTCSTNEPTSATIAVTPAILSKTIALRTLCRLQILYGDRHFLNKLANWALWKVLFDRMWTEYTLYYVTGQCTRLFDNYHFHRVSSMPSLDFYGISVWWRTDWTSFTRSQLLDLIHRGLKWRRKEFDEREGRSLFDLSVSTHYLFTVLQGRQYVNPKSYHELFYPIYLDYLKHQNHTKRLVAILETMTDTLLEKKGR